MPALHLPESPNNGPQQKTGGIRRPEAGGCLFPFLEPKETQ
jgi:hypothetical protein